MHLTIKLDFKPLCCLFFSWYLFFPAPAKSTRGTSYLLILGVILTSLIYVLRLFSTAWPYSCAFLYDLLFSPNRHNDVIVQGL